MSRFYSSNVMDANHNNFADNGNEIDWKSGLLAFLLNVIATEFKKFLQLRVLAVLHLLD